MRTARAAAAAQAQQRFYTFRLGACTALPGEMEGERSRGVELRDRPEGARVNSDGKSWPKQFNWYMGSDTKTPPQQRQEQPPPFH